MNASQNLSNELAQQISVLTEKAPRVCLEPLVIISGSNVTHWYTDLSHTEGRFWNIFASGITTSQLHSYRAFQPPYWQAMVYCSVLQTRHHHYPARDTNQIKPGSLHSTVYVPSNISMWHKYLNISQLYSNPTWVLPTFPGNVSAESTKGSLRSCS